MSTATDDDGTPRFRVLLIGNFASGKTSLVRAYVDNKALDVNEDADTKKKRVAAAAANAGDGEAAFLRELKVGGRKVVVQLIDTQGEERFKTVSCAFYRGTAAVVVAYSVGDAESFASAPQWLSEATLYNSSKAPLVLAVCATKCDLADAARLVTREQGQQLAASTTPTPALYFETTATKPATFGAVLEAVAKACLAGHDALKAAQQQPSVPAGTAVPVHQRKKSDADSGAVCTGDDACCVLL